VTIASNTGASVPRDQLIGRAVDLLPVLKQRAPGAEKLRQIPAETVRDLKAAGLFQIATPRRFGGNGHEIDLMFDVAMELGRACGSSAWCYAVWSIHNWMLGHWPEQAQAEYFADGPDTLSSSSFSPKGKLDPVDGGYRLSGRWDFSSGSDAATWAILGAIGPHGPVFTIVPRADYEIIDTWFVSGLRGTGSKDIEAKGAFVPAHRVVPFMGPVSALHGWELHQRASYKLPTMALLPFTLTAPVVGIAQGAVDEFTRLMRGKSGPGRTADSVAVQIRLGEATAEVDAAKLLVRHNAAELIERASKDETPSELEQARYRLSYAFAVKLSLQAVNRLFEASGGHSLYDSEAMQRFHRDAHAASHQTALYWDALAEGYGRAALGLM
jgi:3-hydroxy-9,10-secoandrosta-1,3,5(10)-triene-9,17-dione monooxygenase